MNCPGHICLYTLLAVFLTACTDKDVTTDEVFRENEAEKAGQAVKNFEQLLEDYKVSYVTRGAHAKGHACLRATFNVLRDIDSRFQHGVFSEPGRHYKSWIRFSNGHFDISVSHDQKNDARGMAIKLLDPPGEPLQVAANNIPTQDFLMTNSPVFFIRNIEDYNDLVSAPENLLSFVFNGFNPIKWRIGTISLARQTLTPPPESLLNEQYFSITAYKLGELNIKFSTKPCHTREWTSNVDMTDPDFLKKQLSTDMKAGEACFEFMVQEQVVEKGMSIEDPTIEWNEEDSPFISLARINIPAQVFDSNEQQDFCENLAFAPWHALPAHQPLGQFNRMRRHVYPASSDYRHQKNQSVVPAEISW